MRKNKALGQHFLADRDLARQITESLTIAGQHDTVVEIGPGEGVLTHTLLEQGYHLILVEFDKRLIPGLMEQFPEVADHIIQADFLKLDMKRVVKAETYSIIGNFPYQISTGILFRIIEDRQRVVEMVGMFQREVAERVAASPGSKVHGITSVLVQAYYAVELLYQVPPDKFKPQPKVHSAVIRLQRRPQPLVKNNYEDLRTIVKAAFNKRRKTLRNALKEFGTKEYLSDDIFSKRAEQLSIAQFDKITTKLIAEG